MHTIQEVYDSPWCKPKEVYLHVDNEFQEDYGISCEQALYDEQCLDSRFNLGCRPGFSYLIPEWRTIEYHGL